MNNIRKPLVENYAQPLQKEHINPFIQTQDSSSQYWETFQAQDDNIYLDFLSDIRLDTACGSV